MSCLVDLHEAVLHYPLTDIQAAFEINRLVRYQIKYREKKLFPQTTDGQTDVAHDNNRYFFRKKKEKTIKKSMDTYTNTQITYIIIINLLCDTL